MHTNCWTEDPWHMLRYFSHGQIIHSFNDVEIMGWLVLGIFQKVPYQERK